jgi:hypothetical protein
MVHRTPSPSAFATRGSSGARAEVVSPWDVLLLVLLLVLVGGCDDATGPQPSEGRVLGVVLNSVDISLTIFDAEDPEGSPPVTVGLAADGSPVSFDVRGRWAAVPLGTAPAVAVVDLRTSTVARTIPLPEGSGASGVAFVNDSIAVVTNSGRNTVSPVDVWNGTVGSEIPVGLYPQAALLAGDRVVIVNARLGPDFLPIGPGTLTVLNRETLEIEGTVALEGVNPGAVAAGAGGRLYVVSSGSFGEGNGALSVIELGGLAETGYHTGFGEFPYAAALSPSGLLYVGSLGFGVAVWDPATESFVRSPAQAITPEGQPSTSGLAFDPAGRLYTLRPDCASTGAALRLDETYAVEAVIPTGVCPFAIAFTTVEE